MVKTNKKQERISKIIPQCVKSVIAQTSKTEYTSINNNTPFMAKNGFPFWICSDILFELQHRFHIVLPEANYCKYDTVGGLIKDVKNQQKSNEYWMVCMHRVRHR